jgi:hypothetical protein
MDSLDRSYRATWGGMRAWFTGPEARALCTHVAEQGADIARGLAPTGTPPDDKHPGRYRDSIRVVQAGLGGLKHDRVRVDILADVPYAVAVERRAHVGDGRGYKVLGRTLDELRGAWS